MFVINIGNFHDYFCFRKVEKIHKVALELEEIHKIKEFKDNLKRRQTWTKTHTYVELPYKSCPSIPRIDTMTNSGKFQVNLHNNLENSRKRDKQ